MQRSGFSCLVPRTRPETVAFKLDFRTLVQEVVLGISPDSKISDYVAASTQLHRVLLNLLLLKYGILVRPFHELEALAEANQGIDTWFELMKRYQQYSEEDPCNLKGSSLLDWTLSPDIALYFANDNRSGDGVVYICDATATGKTLQIIPVGEILDKMNQVGNSGHSLGSPLLFCPPEQVHSQRAKNQQAVYFAQMDLRIDLETHWRVVEKENGGEIILVKLVLPSGTEEETKQYLLDSGISESFIYPDK